MPEGPEVAIVVDQISRFVEGRSITKVQYASGRYSREKKPFGDEDLKSSLPAMIEAVRAKGKFIYFLLEDAPYIFNTLGMTGNWSIVKDGEEFPKHGHARFTLDNNTTLVFCDMRNFGTLKYVSESKALQKKLDSLGWDPLRQSVLQSKKFITKAKLRQTKKTIAEVLMNQSYFAGVGNYIKAEVLYMSKISPNRPVYDVSDKEWELLCKIICDVMSSSYKYRGTTIKNYRSPNGNEGSFQFKLKVYGKKEDPEGNKVIKETTKDKRTTHWVPSVQT